MNDCKYCQLVNCEGTAILKEPNDEFTVRIATAMFDKKDHVMLGVFHGLDFDDVEIKYCPMCGRNFAGDNQMNLFNC